MFKKLVFCTLVFAHINAMKSELPQIGVVLMNAEEIDLRIKIEPPIFKELVNCDNNNRSQITIAISRWPEIINIFALPIMKNSGVEKLVYRDVQSGVNFVMFQQESKGGAISYCYKQKAINQFLKQNMNQNIRQFTLTGFNTNEMSTVPDKVSGTQIENKIFQRIMEDLKMDREGTLKKLELAVAKAISKSSGI